MLQDVGTNHVIHAEKLQMMSLHISLRQICQILHLQVEHHLRSRGELPLSGGQSSSRGPGTVRRVRRTYQDEQVGPPNPSDWVPFDAGSTLRALRNNGPTVRRKLIRKLHIRLWHASAQAVTRLLERAGVPKEALEIIPDIVDTCASCRTWSQPLPQSVASVNIPDKFNDQVECDIVFIHSHAVLHFVDRCTRWHAVVIVPGKSEDSRIKAFHSH